MKDLTLELCVRDIKNCDDHTLLIIAVIMHVRNLRSWEIKAREKFQLVRDKLFGGGISSLNENIHKGYHRIT